jgi:N-acetylglucosamine-6-phosphate deacetylase
MIIRGRHYLEGQVKDFILKKGVIAGITDPLHLEFIGNGNYWIAPGLIDIQVNGYRGVDFCSTNINIEEIRWVANALTAAGVTGFCPTLTTNSREVMLAGVRSIVSAIKNYPRLIPQIICIHLEGPYISSEDGPRGAHPREYVRNPDWDEFQLFQDAADGMIGMITIAPELFGAMDFITKATKAGVIVALGHHAANNEQIKRAVMAGAILSTHLGNGAHSQLPRHPNYLWEQLAEDGLMASMIVDGFHLPPSVVKSFFRVKGPDRLILVSDLVSTAGLSPGKYDLMGNSVNVQKDGSIRLARTPYLAGSALKLCDAIHNVIEYAGATLAEAIQMASLNPSNILGVLPNQGSLDVGTPANIIILGDKPGYELINTIINGEIVYKDS